jgi:peptidoglycan hydrolase CwlO-like protein
MKTFISGIFLSLPFTSLMAQTSHQKKDLDASIKHYQTVSAELQAEVKRIDNHVRKADSLYLIKIDSLNVVLEKLNEETSRIKEIMAECEKKQIRLKEELLANMKARGIQADLD